MQRNSVLLRLVLPDVLLCLICCSATIVPDRIPVEGTDVGFESGTFGYHIIVNPRSAASATYELQAPWAARSGSQGVAIEVQDTTYHSADVQFKTAYITLYKGTSYLWTFWSTCGPEDGKPRLAVVDDFGNEYGSALTTVVQAWSQYQVPFTSEATARYSLSIQLAKVATTYYFDDFALLNTTESLPASTQQLASLTPMEAPAPSASFADAPDASDTTLPSSSSSSTTNATTAATDATAITADDSSVQPIIMDSDSGTNNNNPDASGDNTNTSMGDNGTDPDANASQDSNIGMSAATDSASNKGSSGEGTAGDGDSINMPETVTLMRGDEGSSGVVAASTLGDNSTIDAKTVSDMLTASGLGASQVGSLPTGSTSLTGSALNLTDEQGAIKDVVLPTIAGINLDTDPAWVANFEVNDGEMSLYVEKSAAMATKSRSSAAGRDSSQGLMVTVTRPGTENWHIQLKTPVFQFKSDSLYSFVLFAKASAPGVAQLDLLTAGKFDWVSGVAMSMTTEWQQFSLVGVQPPTTGSYFYTLNMGLLTGSFFFDDIRLMEAAIPPGGISASLSTAIAQGVAAMANIDYSASTGQLFDEDFGQAPTVLSSLVQPPAVATVSLSTTNAGRDGKYGATFAVESPGTQGWHVQLKTVNMKLTPANMYTFTFWAKADRDVVVPVDMVTAGDFTWLDGKMMQFTTTWQQYSLIAIQPRQEGSFLYTFSMGNHSATYYFDEITLRADPAPLPSNLTADIDVSADIEAHRKKDFVLSFMDSTGSAITSLDVLNLTLVQHAFPFGTAVKTVTEGKAQLNEADSDWYYKTMAENFNAIVPENIFKWPEFEPTRGQSEAGRNEMDKWVKLAQDSDMVMIRGHALEWLQDGFGMDDHWSRQEGCDEYPGFLKERIDRDVLYYQGKINSYDVWNEPLNERAFGDECDVWNSTIFDAFRWARADDPSAQLCLNDYFLIDGQKTDDMVDLVKQFQERNVPLDCIGIQAHLDIDQPSRSLGSMKYRMDMLAELGVPLLITEFDIRNGEVPNGGLGNPTLTADADTQAKVMTNLIKFWFSQPSVSGIFLWNFWDTVTWVKGGGIYAQDKTPKAAALAIQKLWTVDWTTKVANTSLALENGEFKFRGFPGKYEYTVEANGKLYSGQMALDSPATLEVSLS